MKRVFVVFVSLLITSSLSAQLQGGSGLSFYAESGKVFPHTDNFKFSTTGINSMLRLQYSMQLDSSVHWSYAYGDPLLSIEMNLTRYGNYSVLGESIGIVPHINFPLFSFRKSSLWFIFGTGIAYNTEIYDAQNNPSNNAISTYWNNQTHIGFSYRYRFNSYESIQTGISLWHNSNGAGKSPNLGLNAVHLSIGYTGLFSHKAPFKYKKSDYLWYENPIQVEINTGVGLHQTRELRGPTYLVQSHELRLKMRTTDVFFVSTGIQTDLNTAHVDFFLNSFTVHSRDLAEKRARRYAVTVGGETVFGDVAFGAQAGIYVSAEVKPFPVYNKLYLRYYLLGKSEWIPRLHLGVVLKSHVATAEYIALRVGMTIKK